MAADEAIKQTPEVADANEPEGERDRSTIVFPYGDLDDAISIGKTVHVVGGSTCDWDQVAAHLSQSANSGSFRQKMLTAKTFGVITYSQLKVTLTQLGSRICDPKQEKMAKADAFLTVPLYRAVFDKFKGNTLPPPNGLEAEMINLGVAKKQKERARQVFQRSATQAGFFWSGQDRLVMPARGNGAEPQAAHENKETPRDEGKQNDNRGGGNGGGGDQHPFIQGLIKTLPPPDSEWPMQKRAKWLQAASHVFDLIYTEEGGGGAIEVKIQKDSR